MDPLMLDGNAVAGLLQEVFAAEMTTAVGTCATCGANEPIGAVHVFRGAGVVLRCPHCGNALATIVKSNRYRGTRKVQSLAHVDSGKPELADGIHLRLEFLYRQNIADVSWLRMAKRAVRQLKLVIHQDNYRLLLSAHR